MKKFVSLLIIFSVVLISGIKTYGSETSSKIGYINLQKILMESNEGRKAKAALKRQFAVRKKELNEKKHELEKMQKSLAAQNALLSRDTLIEKQAEFVKKRDEFLKLVQQYDKELQNEDGKLTQGIILKIQGIVTKIGKKGHYSVILEKSQGGILYAPESEDLTDRVLKLFNNEFGKKK